MALDIETLKPFGEAALIGLGFAYYKYRSNILDPTKPTPEEFKPVKALSTTILAVVLCIVFQFAGNRLDMAGLETQMGVFAGLATGTIEPGINAVIRWIKDRK